MKDGTRFENTNRLYPQICQLLHEANGLKSHVVCVYFCVNSPVTFNNGYSQEDGVTLHDEEGEYREPEPRLS